MLAVGVRPEKAGFKRSGFSHVRAYLHLPRSLQFMIAGQAMARRRPIQRVFQACGAAHPFSNFWVEPKVLPKLVKAVKDGKLIVVRFLAQKTLVMSMSIHRKSAQVDSRDALLWE